MSSRRHSTTHSTVRTIYTSPCGLLTIECHGLNDYSYSIEGQVKGYATTSRDAEHEGHALLCELLEETAITTADIEAEIADVLDDLTTAADQVRGEATPEWADALDAGWSWLLDQDVISIDTHGSLLVPSSRNPSTVYRANGICQCPAFTKTSTPKPCYHRGAGMIVERWRENAAIDAYAEMQELFV